MNFGQPRWLAQAALLATLTVSPLTLFAQESATEADLDSVKVYLLEKTAELSEATGALLIPATEYLALAEAAGFDYAAITENEDAIAALNEAREAWIVASPLYEQMEGIVAGVPTLAQYDVNLDAGVSGEEDPENGVTYDLTLADGRTIARPGNAFGVLESTLWGTRPDYSTGVEAEINGDADDSFGDVLPDAYVLAAGATALDTLARDLATDAGAWQPTETDAFTALVVMVPTMSEYFGSWKDSRFVSGEESESADFNVISRLSDIQDILGGLQVVYDGVSPLVASVDTAQERQIRENLLDLQAYVGDLYTQEQDGTRYTPEQADFFGSEAQDRAQTITGQIAQVAALLEIELPE